MSIPRSAGRLFAASLLGLGSVAACAGAAPGATTPLAPAPSASASASALACVEPIVPILGEDLAAKQRSDPNKAADAGPPSGDAAPRCPYGELNDPHRGFIRCLLPDERGANWLPPPSQEPAPPPTQTPDAGPPPDAGKDVKEPRPSAPPQVEIGTPSFENGEVGKAEKALNAASADIGKCVAEHGGLDGAAGSLKVQFLVRSRGRAEGVEIVTRKGVSPEAASCVRVLLKNKQIGAPTADPVGVTVTISLKPSVK